MLRALELCDAQSIHTCAATARKSLSAPLRNSLILMNWQLCLLIINPVFR